MPSPALRRVGRLVATTLLLAAGVASAQTKASARPATASPSVREGRLDVLVEDYADGHSRTRHFLTTAQGRIELTFAGIPPHLRSGSRVRVHGQLQGGTLALDGSAGSIETLATVMPNTMGEQSIAVLMVNFQDDTSQPMTVADAQNLVLGDVSHHYQESSFGQTWFKGQAFGWYTIAMSKTVCDYTKLASLADAQAKLAGVNLDAFQRHVYMFPTNSCQWLGLGYIGGGNTQAWINGTMTLQVVGHELGHNYGLYHAHSLDCDSTVFETPGTTCAHYGYGDGADMMGNLNAGQFNPFEKEELGWLNDGISPPITTAATNGRYAIEPYSASTVGAKALKIPRGTDSDGHKLWFYVEYRQPVGGDSVLAGKGNLTQGVMVRTATDGDPDSSYQLDMTPGSSTSYYDEMADGALAVGKSVYDGDSGVTITLASASSTGADVDVQFGAPTCTRATPYVYLGAMTPFSVPGGTTVRYDLEVTNYDSVACPATTFDLAGNLPAGWTSTVDATRLTMKPGVTLSTVLNVTSPVTAALGDYKIGATASSPDSALHAGSALTVLYHVTPPCVPAAPTVSLTGGDTAVVPGTPVAYTLTVTNHDGNYCLATNFTLASSVPTGWTGALRARSLSLNAGATGSTVLTVISNTSAAAGSYGIGAAAAGDALHTANASTTYTVAPTCVRAAPAVSLTGGGTPVPAAGTVSYTLSVTNRDSAVCPATSFTLARSAPSGWVSALSKTTMALGPGGTGSAVLTVTSPATAAGGRYGVGAATASTIGAVHTANASANYLVAPKLSIADASIIEGNTGTKTANFVVSLAQPAVVPVTFHVATANGTATAGSDYTATSLAVTIPAGSTQVTVSVPVIGDTAVEADETFQVVVGNVVGAVVSRGTATATIRNDDTVLSIADASIVEGNSGTKALSFTVKLSAPSANPVTFNLATANKTAVAGSDYVALALTGQSIPAGSTSKAFNVTINGDTVREGNETFVVNVGSVAGAVVGDAQALGTIVNDD